MSVNRARIARGVCAGVLGASLMVGAAATANAAPTAAAAPPPPQLTLTQQRCVSLIISNAFKAGLQNPRQMQTLIRGAVTQAVKECFPATGGGTPPPPATTPEDLGVSNQ